MRLNGISLPHVFGIITVIMCSRSVVHGVQSSGLQLGGPALVPDMMYRILDIFNPSNARLLAATAAGGLPFCLSRICQHAATRLPDS